MSFAPMAEREVGKRVFQAPRSPRDRLVRQVIGAAASITYGVWIEALLIYDWHSAVRMWAVHGIVAVALWWWWKSSTHHRDRLVVARDRWRYAQARGLDEFDLPVLGYDEERREVRVMLAGVASQKPVPGLASDEDARWIEAAARLRERRVGDELLSLSTFAAVRAQLGLGVSSAAPFRADGATLTREVASTLLDDRSSSRAELVAASAVLVERGGEAERARVIEVAEACDDVFFRDLLRAIARGDDVEARYESFRAGAGRAGRVYNALLPRLLALMGVTVASSLVLRAPTLSVLSSMLPGLGVVALLGEWRRRAFRRGVVRAKLDATTWLSWSAMRDVVSVAVAISIFRSHVPPWAVPVLLYATFWARQLLAPRAKGEEPVVSSQVRVDVATTEGEVREESAAPKTVAEENAQRRG